MGKFYRFFTFRPFHKAQTQAKPAGQPVFAGSRLHRREKGRFGRAPALQAAAARRQPHGRRQLHRPRPHAVAAQPGRHLVRQGRQRRAHLGGGGQVMGEGAPAAHALHRLFFTPKAHRRVVQPPGVAAQGVPQLAQGGGQRPLVRRRQVPDGGSIRFLDEQIPRLSVGESEEHQLHRLVQVHEETGHVRVGDGDGLARLDLLDEQGDHAAPAAHHVAVAGAADGGVLRLDGAGFRADDLFHHRLGRSHSIDRIGCLVRRQTYYFFHPCLNSRSKYVFRAQHIGLHCFDREEFAGRNLLQCCRVENIVDTMHSILHRLKISNIPNVKFNLVACFRELCLIFMAHIVLFFLISGKDTDLSDISIQETV